MILKNVVWSPAFPLKEEIIKEIPSQTMGVYLIWPAEDYTYPRMTYVGSGKIAKRLKDHLTDPEDPVVQAQIPHLKASYAIFKEENISEEDFRGAENYLAYVYQPVIGSDYPDITPREIPILPFQKDYNPLIIGEPYPLNGAMQLFINWMKYVSSFCDWAKEQHDGCYQGPKR